MMLVVVDLSMIILDSVFAVVVASFGPEFPAHQHYFCRVSVFLQV